MSVETSAPGSIHDSADDESELSELEEDDGDDEDEVSVKPIFPGLASRERTEAEDSEMEIEGDDTVDDGRDDAEMVDPEGEGDVANEGAAEAEQDDANGGES